jgi:pimeloyl-ACP methyl ester carboxylesterase
MIPAHRTGTCPSGDVTLSYRLLGKGPLTPILFVHGLSYFSYDWLDFAAAFGAQRSCAAVDMRGFGDSSWSKSKDYSVPTMAQDLLALLDHLGWKRAIVLGHSMGGRSCAQLAAKHPQRVAGLMLIDYSPENAPAGSKRIATTVAGTPERFASIDEALQYFKARPDKRERYEAYLKPVAGGYAVKRDPHFRDQFRKMLESGERAKLGVDMWQVLGEVRCPILSVRGARSDMYAPETVSKMTAANPGLRVVEVDAGHNIGGENPDGLLAVLKPFVAELEEKSRERIA